MLFSGCGSLETVDIPEGVRSIGSGAFQNNAALRRITFPGSLEVLAVKAFKLCPGLEEVTLPAGLIYLGDEAFAGCSHLRRTVFPAGLERIGRGAFLDCAALEQLSLPDGLRHIGKSAFEGCRGLRRVSLPGKLAEIPDGCFRSCGSLESVSCPITLKDIGDEAFYGCQSLAGIDLPEGLERIGARAFDGCTALAEIALPRSLVRAEARAFYAARVLHVWGWPEGLENAVDRETLRQLDADDLAGVPKGFLMLAIDTLVSGPEREPLPEKARRGQGFLRENALRFLREALDRPKLLRYLCSHRLISAGDIDTFLDAAIARGDTEAQRLLTHTIREMGEEVAIARADRRAARTAYLRAREERSAGWDFDRGIAGLHFLFARVPSRVWGSEAALCAHLARYGAVLDAGVSPALDFLITDDGDGGETVVRARELGVPILTEAEFNALVGKRFADAESFVLPSWIDEIPDNAFMNCRCLKKVVLHKGVTRIGNLSFSGCFRLTDVKLPAGLTHIGAGAFQNCSSLGEIRLPEGLEHLGERAFEKCTGLETLALPEGIAEVSASLCKGCTNLKQVTLPKSARKIGEYAFE